MCFIGVIGKRFQDGGSRYVLIESNVVAKASVNGFFLENITIEQSQFKSNEDNSLSRLPSHSGCIC